MTSFPKHWGDKEPGVGGTAFFFGGFQELSTPHLTSGHPPLMALESLGARPKIFVIRIFLSAIEQVVYIFKAICPTIGLNKKNGCR